MRVWFVCVILWQKINSGDQLVPDVEEIAVNNIVDGFLEQEKRYADPSMTFGYFIVYTPTSRQLSRNARLVNKAMEEADSLAAGTNKGGADYAMDYNAESWKALSKAEKLERIFKAIDKKNIEMKKNTRRSSSLFRSEVPKKQSPFKVTIEGSVKNPVTGKNVQKKELGIRSITDKEVDLSAEGCKRGGVTECFSSERYRRVDGTCNNLGQSHWGAANRPYRRILPAEYPDGKGLFKTHINRTLGGKLRELELPNVRILSRKLHQDIAQDDKPHKSLKTSHMLMQWGQFLDHDMTLTPEPELKCCHKDNVEDVNCAPIYIEKWERKDDFIYNYLERRKHNQVCIPFSRSEAVCNVGGEDAVREQYNANTAFMDLSTIYGSEQMIETHLRTKEGDFKKKGEFWSNLGTLKENAKQKWNLPTREQVGLGDMFHKDKGDYKVSGDNRCVEHPALLTLHTIFFSEHNRIAKELQKTQAFRQNIHRFNSTKEMDILIFQETKKLVAATFQAITYQEYLPLVLGPQLMREYRLVTQQDQDSTYESQLDPTIWHEFATFAYRFGHSLISRDFSKMKGAGSSYSTYFLKDAFFNVSLMENKRRHAWWFSIMRGLTAQNADKADRYINSDLGNRLFMSKEKELLRSGGKIRMELSDLTARNIHRGRDHGLSDYNSYRKWALLTDLTKYEIEPCYECCRWKRTKTLNRVKMSYRFCMRHKTKSPDCERCLEQRATEVLADAKKQPQDIALQDFIDLGEAYFWFLDWIDPFTGSIFEKPVTGGEVGPTNGKIIADTFNRIKYGDRFFFTHKSNGDVRGLGKVAKQNIFRRTLSAVMCDNAPIYKKFLNKLKMPENAFKSESETKKLSCKDILNEKHLNFEEIAQEIVDSFDSTSQGSCSTLSDCEEATCDGSRCVPYECEWDDDCGRKYEKDNYEAPLGAYAACTDRRCRFVTGQCLKDADCAGVQCNETSTVCQVDADKLTSLRCQEEDCERLGDICKLEDGSPRCTRNKN